MKIARPCLLVLIYAYFAIGKRIKPPIPQELKEACKNAGNRKEKRSCLNEQLKQYCQKESNTDTITCKLVRVKTLIPDPISGMSHTHISHTQTHITLSYLSYTAILGIIFDLFSDECTLISSDDFDDEEDCIEEKLEAFCQVIDNHETTACKCASSRSSRRGST